MLRSYFHRLLVSLAFAAAFLTPCAARATILPACENRELLTAVPRPPIVAPDGGADAACTSAVRPVVDEGADSKVAALCDHRGASAIAPQRILPINDARIECGPGGEDASRSRIGSAHEGASSGPVGWLGDHAVIASDVMVPVASSVLLPAFPGPDGEARAGSTRSVYHPPR